MLLRLHFCARRSPWLVFHQFQRPEGRNAFGILLLPLPSQQTAFILPSTPLFPGSMAHQDDELVPVVTVALSITADIPGGHPSPKDSSRLGNSAEATTITCNGATPKPRSCSTGRASPDLPRLPGHQHSIASVEHAAGLDLARCCLFLSSLSFHLVISSLRAIWINMPSWGMISFPAYLS